MTDLKTLISDLNNLVLSGKMMEAFETYYHPDVVMQENENTPTVGKELNREREKDFLANLVDFRNAEVLETAVGESTTMVMWYYDYTHKEWGLRRYTQVSVQHWQDNQIIREQFFYGN